MTSTFTPKRDEPLFRLDGDLLVPGVLCRGPWYEGSIHGSAMLAAMARGAELHPSDVPRQVVRLTIDMMRAAPMAPLRVETSTVRSGKSVDFVDLALYAEDELWVRGSALRVRTADVDIEPTDAGPYPAPPPHDYPVTPPYGGPGGEEPAFHHAVDMHVDSEQETLWFRLAVPIVEGETNSGFVTAAAIADWTYAVPTLLEAGAGGPSFVEDQTVFTINVDTTMNTFRPPSGEWLGMRTTSHVDSIGAGSASAHVFDEMGPCGFYSQSILVRGPSGAPR